VSRAVRTAVPNQTQRDQSRRDELSAEAYDLLRAMASRKLRTQRPSATLNTTLVVHEAWMKLFHDKNRQFVDEDHFLATASRAMRQILVDHVRRKLTDKRGAGAVHVPLEGQQVAEPDAGVQIMDVDAALVRLAQHAPELEQIVECRFFAGYTVNETARILGRPVRSVERDWARARTYLAAYLKSEAKT